MKKSTLALCLGVALSATAANAEVGLLGFTGPVNLGLNLDLTDYELDTQSFLATAALGKTVGIYNIGLDLTAVNKAKRDANDETVRTAENYGIAASTGRDLDERQSISGVLAWGKDNFTDYDTNSSVSVQYGYKAIKSDMQNLTFGIGPAYIHQTYDDGRDDEGSFGGIATANYDHRITENLTFAQGLSTSFAGGDISDIIDSSTALNYSFNNNLTIGLLHLTKFVDADDGFEETATPATNITVGYTY